MKLKIELIPASCHYKNLRTALKRSEWDKIRKAMYVLADYKCQLCGGVGPRHPVECHEKWEYKNSTQKLSGLIALCPMCHQVVHWAGTLARLGEEYEPKLIAHLMKVNGWTAERTHRHMRHAWDTYTKKCETVWSQDFSWLEKTFQIAVK